MQSFAKMALSLARKQGMFVVLDADALWMVRQDISVIKGYRRAVVTPNVAEFARLSEQLGIDPKTPADKRAGLVSRGLGGVLRCYGVAERRDATDIISVGSLEASQLAGADPEKEKAQGAVAHEKESRAPGTQGGGCCHTMEALRTIKEGIIALDGRGTM
jgi:ATP-dependent NAD(P)H-hydrate dehydratase